MLNFCDFIQVYVFTTNHHLKLFKTELKVSENHNFALYKFQVRRRVNK